MGTPKRDTSSEQTFQAVYEKGVLRPLSPLGLRENSRVTITLRGDSKWRSDFDRLMRKMSRRTRGVSQKEIETEVTQARAEVKATRRATGSSPPALRSWKPRDR